MVREFRIGICEATGIVQTPDIASIMPSHFLQPHIIHPTTLDSIFQLSLPLYLRHCARGSIMPVSIDEISISARLNSKAGTDLQVATNLTPLGPRSAAIETTAFQRNEASEVVPVISITRGELRGLGDAQMLKSRPPTERVVTYRMEWKPDITFDNKLEPEGLPMIPSVNLDSISIEDKEILLIQSASLYIKESMDHLVERDLHVPAEHHRLLVQWMKSYLATTDCQKLVNIQMDANTIYARAKEAGVEGEIISRTGSQLTQILTGKVDPLAVMLEDNLLYRVYADDSSVRCYTHLISYLKQLVFKKPYLNVLEIGAGAGGTTLPLLKAHTDSGSMFFRNYDYTDVSSGFFEQAQSKFQDWEGLVRFKTLDIERDPMKQGLTEGSYDLVVASNVIHATKYLDSTLSNVRRLLKPDGRFALLEIVNLTPPYMMTFGLLPGWWAGIDDGRTQGPLLKVSQWDIILSRAKFEGAEVVMDDLEGPAHRSSLMITRPAHIPGTECHPRIKVISDETSDVYPIDLLHELASELKSKDDQIDFIPWPSNNDVDDAVYVVMDVGKRPLLLNPDSKTFEQISTLFTHASNILWITGGQSESECCNAEKGLITGFTRVARSENVMLRIITLDIHQDLSSDLSGPVQAVSHILRLAFQSSIDSNVVSDLEYTYRDGRLCVPRLIPDYKINAVAMGSHDGNSKTETDRFHQRALRLHVEKPGLLDSLIFIDDEGATKALGSNEVTVQVAACGINFKDVFISLGQMKAGTRMAGECAGIITPVGSDFEQSFKVGDRVCAFDATPFASQARAKGYNVQRLPDSMSFSEAASVPVVFGTAYYSLIDVAHLAAGQTVLIHAASGGVGQAAIKLAQYISAEIFATVGSVAKRQLLIDQYHIQEDHIFSSRNRHFKKGVLRLTKGKGVDVVLNSLSGEALHDSWSCVARFGTFVEIGKSDIYRKSRLSMDVFDKSVTFASVDLSTLSEYSPIKIQKLLAQVMTLFQSGHLTHVQPITTIPIGEIEHAFRLIQGRKHTGKVVLEARDTTMVKVFAAKLQPLMLERQGTYVIAGGLGDLGRHIARFLASRGAGHIALLSRRKLDDLEEQDFISELQSHGSKLHLLRCDVSDARMIKDSVAFCLERLPPVRGVIQAAMVLQVSVY